MKVAVRINSDSPLDFVEVSIKETLETLADSDITLTDNVHEADLVVANNSTKILGYLKSGKYVIQLLTIGGASTKGLLTAASFKNHFHILAAMDRPEEGLPDLIHMLLYIQELNTKEKV